MSNERLAESIALKCPIGSTSNQWGMKKIPLIEVSLQTMGEILLSDKMIEIITLREGES